MKAYVLFIFLIFSFFSVDKANAQKEYFIRISISACRLWLYEKNYQGDFILIREYMVATVKKTEKGYPIGKGRITKIEFNPSWYPTQRTINEFAKKGIFLPKAIPPGHKLNYMGSFKIYLSHNVPGKGEIFRIHGTRKEDEEKIGTRASGGCVRLLNSEGEELARKISTGTEVEIVL